MNKVRCWRRLRSTTKFNASTPPFSILDLLQDLLNLVFKRNHSDWVGIRLPKDSAHSGNIMGGLQVNLFAENPDVTFDPISAETLDLFDVRIRNTRLVGKVEAQFGRSNERSFLVDMISKDLSKRPVENVGRSVVIPERPST